MCVVWSPATHSLGHSSVTTEISAHLAPNEVSEEAMMVLNGLKLLT